MTREQVIIMYGPGRCHFHPFHVHNVQFLVVDVKGKQPGPSQQGWLDSVLVYPGDRIRLLVQFKYYSDSHHPYMFHCHILEHEDMGMMGQFVVVDRGSKPEEVSVDPEYLAEYSNPMDMGKEKWDECCHPLLGGKRRHFVQQALQRRPQGNRDRRTVERCSSCWMSRTRRARSTSHTAPRAVHSKASGKAN